jgi:hypothetical protein
VAAASAMLRFRKSLRCIKYASLLLLEKSNQLEPQSLASAEALTLAEFHYITNDCDLFLFI